MSDTDVPSSSTPAEAKDNEANAAETSDREETADNEGTGDSVDVEVYVITGTKNLRLPESFCKECNLFVNAVESASEKTDVPVEVSVYSWWTNFFGALRHGGYHPPVMVVGGRRLCQGHHVPSEDEIVGAVREATERRERD